MMSDRTKLVNRWFEAYSCGCVSAYERRKKDLLGYCGKHGDERNGIWRVKVSAEEIRKELDAR